jgi:hypothetical protein
MSELAILGGPRTRAEPYPEWPVWDQRDIDAVTAVDKVFVIFFSLCLRVFVVRNTSTVNYPFC